MNKPKTAKPRRAAPKGRGKTPHPAADVAPADDDEGVAPDPTAPPALGACGTGTCSGHGGAS